MALLGISSEGVGRPRRMGHARSAFSLRHLPAPGRAIKRPPRSWEPDLLWQAYEALDATKVRGSGRRIRSDLVSLVRYALGNTDELVAYPDLVEERFDAWLLQQQNVGRTFTDDQLAYLRMIKDYLAASLTIAPRDLTGAPFSERLGRARQLFGEDLNPLLHELTQAFAA